MSPRLCAYCEKAGPLTKEHVWPQWLNKLEPSYVMRFSAKAQKVFGGDLTVSDVCASCNNGALSKLDGYAHGLHASFFSRILAVEEQISFEYNFNFLARWLLKVSYNSARATGRDEQFFQPLVSYMLGVADKPAFVSVMLDIVAPSVINGHTLEPRAVRCAGIFVGKCRPWVCVRLVAINSYYFYIIITAEKTVKVPQAELLEFRAGVKGRFLRPEGKLVTSSQGSTFYEMHVPHLTEDKRLYDEYLEKYRKLH